MASLAATSPPHSRHPLSVSSGPHCHYAIEDRDDAICSAQVGAPKSMPLNEALRKAVATGDRPVVRQPARSPRSYGPFAH